MAAHPGSRRGAAGRDPQVGGTAVPERGAARDTASFLGHQLVQAAWRLRESTAAALQRTGLAPREFGLLNQVVADGGANQAQLGRRLLIDRTTMVAMVDRLCERGLVERTADPVDRRVYRIAPTAAGRALHERAMAAVLATEREFLAPLSAAQVEALRRALGTLQTAAEVGASDE